jgi:hypothetical protein
LPILAAKALAKRRAVALGGCRRPVLGQPPQGIKPVVVCAHAQASSAIRWGLLDKSAAHATADWRRTISMTVFLERPTLRAISR